MEVVKGTPELMWCPVSGTDTLYVGQPVKWSANGLVPLGAASGAADTTTKSIPYGIVTATNNAVETEVFSSTYNTEYVTQVQSQANQIARNWHGVEGRMYNNNDPQAFVQIARIYPGTKIKAPIFNAAFGTAPTVTTVTVGSTTGAGYTAGACDFTPVANLCTSYCRSGANRGLYRISSDTSTTVRTFGTYWPYDIAVGDTFVSVPITQGLSYIQLEATESMYVDASATPATNYYVVFVDSIDLSVAGKETVTFSFGNVHFDNARA